MEATLQEIDSAPGWEQQQANEQRRFETEERFLAPWNMTNSHILMTERHRRLVCDVLLLAIAVTERTAIRVWVEWAGPQKGLIVRYYLPGNERVCQHDIWFDLDGDREARRKLLQIRDLLSHLGGLCGNA